MTAPDRPDTLGPEAQSDPPDAWLNLEQVAAELGVTVSTVKAWTRPRNGLPQLRASRPGRGVWQFRTSWVDAFRDACAPETPTPSPVPAGHAPDPASTRSIEAVTRPRRSTRRRKRTVPDGDLPLVRPTRPGGES